jgi:hypothetical protein
LSVSCAEDGGRFWRRLPNWILGVGHLGEGERSFFVSACALSRLVSMGGGDGQGDESDWNEVLRKLFVRSVCQRVNISGVKSLRLLG